MPEEKLQTLSLQVINGSELESGRAARCLFTQQGNVGHGPECHWSVQDRQQSIPAQAFTVILHDGTFCLRPQTAQLWLNQAKVTATSDLIQLRQGDEIQIGRLMVRVHLNRGDIPHYDEEMATPETIVTNRDMLTDTLLSTEGTPHYPGMTHRHQLADTVVNGFSADPLQALQSESLITTGDPLSGIAAVRPSAPLSDPASNGGINTPFMDLPPIYASPGDRNDDVSAAEMAQRHLAVTPLLRGLGGSLTMSNSDDADDFLEEAGRTLQAAIKGLLDLQQQRNSLSDKHLRPLEDNPLRLNMDYATALDVMFAEGKSPVHLAAPAAVSESLRNVRHHEEANRAAIVESLRGNSLNPMIDAATPLLGMVMRLSTMNSQTMPEHLFAQVVTDVQAVEQLLQEQGYEPGVIISFRYILCTFIDEAALGNGWSNKNEWIKQSLLVHFHNEAWGGEKVFILLERLIREPKRYQDLLEFLWLCFSLGFRGRYKVAAQDQGEFEQIYRRLYHVLHKLRGDAPFPLLHQDKKTQGGRYQLISRLTIKHIFCGGVVVLALFYLFYLLRLDSQTQDILHQLNKLLR